MTHSYSSQSDGQGCGCQADDFRQGCQCKLPQVTFSTFILSLASSALVQLGEVPNPETGKQEEDLMMANHSIEILAMLQNKTKACLDSDEARLMEELLCELRLKYVMKKK